VVVPQRSPVLSQKSANGGTTSHSTLHFFGHTSTSWTHKTPVSCKICSMDASCWESSSLSFLLPRQPPRRPQGQCSRREILLKFTPPLPILRDVRIYPSIQLVHNHQKCSLHLFGIGQPVVERGQCIRVNVAKCRIAQLPSPQPA
jgi:hypothetical protein